MERDRSVVKLSGTDVAEVGGESSTSFFPDVSLAMSGHVRGAAASVHVVTVNPSLAVMVVDDQVIF